MVRLLTRAAKGKLVVRTVDAGVEEDPLVAAIELSGDGLSPVTLVINRTNGLIEQARYRSELDGRSVETYSDYRNVGGSRFPSTRCRGAARSRRSNVTSRRSVSTCRYRQRCS